MVKITYIGKRGYRSLRNRKGNLFGWNQGETIDVTDESLLEKLKGSKNFIRQDEVGKKTGGGGLKTGSRKPKSGSKAARKPKAKKEVKPKKPKGLKKPKRAD